MNDKNAANDAIAAIIAGANVDESFANVKGRFGELLSARMRERAAVEYLKSATEARENAEKAFKAAMVSALGESVEEDAKAALEWAVPGRAVTLQWVPGANFKVEA